MKRNITIKVKDLAAAINAVGEKDNPTKLFQVCWDINLGGVFDIAAKTSEEAEDELRRRIEAGEVTYDDLECVAEERVYAYEPVTGKKED